jgi:hypothetical protein
VGYCVVDIGVLGFGCDASFQNTSEFIGALLGVRAARICNADMSSLELRGDSVTALQWAQTHRFRGTRVSQSSIVYVLQLIQLKAEVGCVTAISGKDNWQADELSREGGISAICSGTEEHPPDERFVGFHEIPLEGDVILALCDPAHPIDGDAKFATYWAAVRAAIVY